MCYFSGDFGGYFLKYRHSFNRILYKIILVSVICQFFLNPYTCVNAAIHTNEFAVNVPAGLSVANEIAKKYGFVNRGQIGSLENYFLFEHHGIVKRSLEGSSKHSELLQKDSSVVWFEQQVVKRRVKRSIKSFSGFPDPLYPEQWFLHGGGSGNNDMNVIPAWEAGYSGKGVVVSILDDGIQGNHPDLAQNYDKDASSDINDSDDDPTPQNNGDNKHGTRCAGEVAAVANNEFCGVGIAYNASIGGVRMLDGSVTDIIEARALSLNPNHIHIYSASWGPEDDGKTVDGPGKLAKVAFEKGINQGRGGLGSIFVWASGNGGGHSDNCNCDGYTNSIYTISISSATQSGLKPWYLEECSSTLATTYSSGTSNKDQNIVTVDVDFEDIERNVIPTSSKLCTKSHTGTSASAPIAAAICALALEANPNLTWRDMQYLIVLTSRPGPLLKELGWSENGIGRKISTMFGFGLMDAAAMVNLAKNWKPVSEQHVCYSSANSIERFIPSSDGSLETTISTTGCKNHNNSVKFLEHVQARISLHYHPRGSLRITLISPAGTESDILLPRPHDHVDCSFNDWPFMSVHFWGEYPEGVWTLRIVNNGIAATEPGKLTNWSLVFYGTQDLRQSFIHSLNEIVPDTEQESEHIYPVRGVSENNKPLNICSYTNKFLTRVEGLNECVDKCPIGQYGDITDFTCHMCDKSCSSCYGPSYNNCLSCQKFFLSNHMCVKTCPDGFFPDSSNHLCYPCPSACYTCELNGVCNNCKPGYFYHNQKCVLVCPEGTFIEKQMCKKCHESCASCYGPHAYQCLSCDEPLLMHNGSCIQECPNNYYASENFICLRCHRSCESCVDGEFCTKCDSKWNNKHDQCLYSSVCKKGWNNLEESICDPCSSNCLQCSGPGEGDCMSCESGYYWLEGRCASQCPENYFYSRDECSPCYKLCSKCDSSGKCLSCTKGFFLYFGKCYSSCPVGFYDNGNGKCEMCHSECLHCNGNSRFNCTFCQKEFYLVNNSCQPKCPVGYFATSYEDKNECLPCYSTCSTCSGFGPLLCKSCRDNSSFSEGKCIPCLDGEFYDKDSKKCKRCHHKCGRCFGPNDADCLSCTAPLRLDEVNHICLPCCLKTKKPDCCSCSKDLDICLNSDHPRSIVSLTSSVYDEVTIPLRHIVPIMIAICSSVVLLYALVFGLLQAHSMGWCNIKFREQKYERVPNNLAAKFDADMEKVSLTQEDLEDEDEIYEKV